MKQIEEIRKLMFVHQENNGFDTVFDHIDDLLNEIEESVSQMYKPAQALTEKPEVGEIVFFTTAGGCCRVNWDGLWPDKKALLEGWVFEDSIAGALGAILKFKELFKELNGLTK